MKTLPHVMILASGSPRRIELLRTAGFEPRVIKPEVDETPRRGETARAMVRRLAVAKARAVAAGLEASPAGLQLIIAADTTVVAPGSGRILGKPDDAAHALRMLASLSGRTHSVLTGYCVIAVQPGKNTLEFARVVASRVRMRKVSRNLLQQYVATGEPLDKAGAYGIQGIGSVLVESVSGSFANVVGLPIAQLVADLEERFRIYRARP